MLMVLFAWIHKEMARVVLQVIGHASLLVLVIADPAIGHKAPVSTGIVQPR